MALSEVEFNISCPFCLKFHHSKYADVLDKKVMECRETAKMQGTYPTMRKMLEEMDVRMPTPPEMSAGLYKDAYGAWRDPHTQIEHIQ